MQMLSCWRVTSILVARGANGTTRCGVRSAQRADPTSIYATRNPGAGQDITCLAAAVQLRLRVAVGLQALQRCSGLLNRRARGSTVATHHFGGGTRIEKFMRSLACPARRIKLLPSASSSVSFQRSRSSTYRAPRFERGGCRRESCRECQFHLGYATYN